MDFEYNGVIYFIHRYLKDFYGEANYIYYKDGDLVFIDYYNKELEKTIELFKQLKSLH